MCGVGVKGHVTSKTVNQIRYKGDNSSAKQLQARREEEERWAAEGCEDGEGW